MVCLRHPRKPNHLLIKRIAALETPLGRIDVPKNHIWVVSDGGNGYLDSSVFGVVNFNDVLGDAKFIVFPPHRIGKIQVNSFTLVRIPHWTAAPPQKDRNFSISAFMQSIAENADCCGECESALEGEVSLCRFLYCHNCTISGLN